MIKKYDDIIIKRAEIYRLLGYGRNMPDNTTLQLIDECIKVLKPDYKVVYKKSSVVCKEDSICFEDFKVTSKGLAKFLQNSEETVIFCATIGINFDREIQKFLISSPAKAVILQAVGAAAVESLCDRFCSDLSLKKRFSAGFSDLDLEYQKNIFAYLAPQKTIGVTLTDSNLMVPTKSVSAFGI